MAIDLKLHDIQSLALSFVLSLKASAYLIFIKQPITKRPGIDLFNRSDWCGGEDGPGANPIIDLVGEAKLCPFQCLVLFSLGLFCKCLYTQSVSIRIRQIIVVSLKCVFSPTGANSVRLSVLCTCRTEGCIILGILNSWLDDVWKGSVGVFAYFWRLNVCMHYIGVWVGGVSLWICIWS